MAAYCGCFLQKMEFPVLSLCNCILRSPRGSRRAIALAAGIALFGVVGCQSVPRLHSPAGVAWSVASASELAGESQKPLFAAAPDFDQPAELSPAVTAPAATENLSAATPAPVPAPASSAAPAPTVAAAPASAPASAPSASPLSPAEKPVTDKAVVLATETLKQATAPKSSIGKDLDSQDSAAASAPAGSPWSTTAPPQSAKADGTAAVSSGATKVAQQPPTAIETQSPVKKTEKAPEPRQLPKYSERRPEAFTWRRTGRSAGGRPFEISLTGENGFRTLFIGSAVGNDPVPVNLMERLAKYVHENGLILGGFEAAVIRTLNPDGAATGQPTNALGRYVNGRFPLKPDQKPAVSTPEVDFLLSSIRSFRPQRIVHVRTVDDPVGVIASNERCAETARTVADALKFSRLTYPVHSREGSLEFCFSGQADLDVITLGLPRAAKADGDPWTLYGDTLLNLLQPRMEAGREASRVTPAAGEKSP